MLSTSPRRLERPTYRLGGDRSIQLSYEDIYENLLISRNPNL